MNTKHLSTAALAAQRERWERIGLGIRLAYYRGKPEVLRVWWGLGQRMTRAGGLEEAILLRQTLRLLIQVAHDEALPWCWRTVCLEATTLPLARLLSVLGIHDPLTGQALLGMVQRAHEMLAAVPASRRLGSAA